MERDKRTIEYRFGSNQFPMPTNLRYSRLYFYRLSDAEVMLEKCWDDEAMEIIISFSGVKMILCSTERNYLM